MNVHPTMRAALAHLLPPEQRADALAAIKPHPTPRAFRVERIDASGTRRAVIVQAASSMQALDTAMAAFPDCNSFQAQPAPAGSF
jgi:hypothetical protein